VSPVTSLLLALCLPALADEPLAERARHEGTVDFAFVGTPLAIDSDADGRADTLALPASFGTTAAQLPAGSILAAATLYWGGTQVDPGAPCTGTPDDTVTLEAPDGTVVPVTADRCDCAEGGAAAYDVWTCSADLAAELSATGLVGTWSVDGYTGLIGGGDTDHAAAGLLLVAEHPSFPPRTIVVADGLETLSGGTSTLTVPSLVVDGPATGELAYLALEGDPTAGPGEFVAIDASPSGTSSVLADASNPAGDPMNRTIGAVTDTVGIDLDRYDLSGSMVAGDDRVDVTFGAGLDKFWPVAVVLAIDTFSPDLTGSAMSWTLDLDADGSGDVSPGDVLGVALDLSNAGTTEALVNVSAPIPGAIGSWILTDDGNGIDVSGPALLALDDVSVPAGSTVTVSFDAVVDPTPGVVPDLTTFPFTASWTGDDSGAAATTDVLVRVDSDGDGVRDDDDLCPADVDPLQEDTDSDGIGDACDLCPDDTGSGGPDTDGDGVPDACDRCEGYLDSLDADNDSVPDACDVCANENDLLDADNDSVPDGCDICPAGDDTSDADLDLVPDACDACEGFPDGNDADNDGVPDDCDDCLGNDGLDGDADGVPDACDVCLLGPDDEDADNDSVPDACDVCPAGDDTSDSDLDGVADACDACEGSPDDEDDDNDGVPDGCDQCFGNDALDADMDTVPDACDVCALGNDLEDADNDSIPDACDLCDGVDDTADADNDGVPDACDQCDGGDDADDADGDGVPDECDVCDNFDDHADTDFDGFPDACDVCPTKADPGQLDNDSDGLGDACDPCPTTAFQTDTDGDGTWSCQDCDDTDPFLDASDADRDGWTSCDGDCADDDPNTFPGAGELPNGIDDDCSGQVDEGTARYDDDGDGFTELGGDCDDGNPDTSPAAAEVCDGSDQDCDGTADEGTECYDDDGDGTCEGPSCTDGSLPGDCNDGDPLAYPGADEVQGNGIDDDCDGDVDDAVSDLDGDGISLDGGDCDDDDPTTAPGFPELPDGIDNDCDGVVDEGTVRGDDDGDGWTELEGDCHDGDATIAPGASEPEDGIDNDCNGIVDDGSRSTDDDGDGFAEAAGDCDDGDERVYPGATESDNGIDDDCDGAVDEDFTDLDGDGFSFANGDCNDLEGWVNPGVTEMCDGLDNDCDGRADEDGVCDDGSGSAQVGSAEPRGENRGCHTAGGSTGLLGSAMLALALGLRRRRVVAVAVGAATLAGCTTETGFTAIQSRLAVTPSTLLDLGDVPVGQATTRRVTLTHLEGSDIEIYDIALTDPVGNAFEYTGPPSTTLFADSSLSLPVRYLPQTEGFHWTRLEITHGGLTDQLVVDIRGHALGMELEARPMGLDFGPVVVGEEGLLEVTVTNRGATELRLDDAYTSNERFEAVLDLPVGVPAGRSLVVPVAFRPTSDAPASGELVLGAGDAVGARIALWGNDCVAGLVEAWDTDRDGFSACATDCDDGDPTVHPGAQEVADGIDQDCDGLIDEGTTGVDDDGDGYCDDPLACTDGSLPGDCADQDPDMSPGADELLDNGLDDDCDGRVDFGVADDDADGVALSGGDCDDLDPTVFPGAPELVDGVDNDCDGTVDEGTIAGDDDGDGWCEGPQCSDGSSPGDCDDTDDRTWPGAVETADWTDNDCDGRIDEGTARADDDRDGYTEEGGDCDDSDPTLSPGLGTC